MKKIGILFGKENTFPQAFVDRVNSKNLKGIQAELLRMEEVKQAQPSNYAVIIDRISQDVPFYRSFLKNAALCGAAVINNPFWWSADEKFFNNCLAERIGIPVPKTVLLPSKERPEDTNEDSFRNMEFLDWNRVFDYLGGFPLFLKPHSGGGWKNVYKVDNEEELFAAYHETGQLVMMLQEAIDFSAYFRCYSIGEKTVRIMHYEPRNPHHLRYQAEHKVSDKLMNTMEHYVRKLNDALGYDFNTVEFAIRDGVPFAIDFCNPAPDADIHSVGEENFEWVVETAANLAIDRARKQKPGQSNLRWGTFVKHSIQSSVPDSGIAPQKTASKKKAAKSGTTVAPDNKALLNAIGQAKAKEKDDLKQIKGIGPKLEKMLNGIGITSYKQVSKMTGKEYDMVDSLLDAFRGRGKRDDWAGQAKKLMKK